MLKATNFISKNIWAQTLNIWLHVKEISLGCVNFSGDTSVLFCGHFMFRKNEKNLYFNKKNWMRNCREIWLQWWSLSCTNTNICIYFCEFKLNPYQMILNKRCMVLITTISKLWPKRWWWHKLRSLNHKSCKFLYKICGYTSSRQICNHFRQSC